MVAVSAMRVVEMITDQVVHVISVRHRRVTAVGAVGMAVGVAAAAVLRRASVGVGVGDLELMLVVVVRVRMVQVTVVEIVDVLIVLHAGMPAASAVSMRVLPVSVVFSHARTCSLSAAGEPRRRRLDRGCAVTCPEQPS